jgi:hypothetical protein
MKKTCKKKIHSQQTIPLSTLIEQLQQIEKYWIQSNYLLKKESTVNQTTFNKRKKRILCFMEWCVKPFKSLLLISYYLTPTNSSIEHRERYETYLRYLKNDKYLNNGTIVEYITTAIFALKFLFAR